MLHSGKIGLEFPGASFVQVQLVIMPSALNCTGERSALEDYQQNNNLVHLVMMDLIIVSDMESITGNSFDITGGLKQHTS